MSKATRGWTCLVYLGTAGLAPPGWEGGSQPRTRGGDTGGDEAGKLLMPDHKGVWLEGKEPKWY